MLHLTLSTSLKTLDPNAIILGYTLASTYEWGGIIQSLTPQQSVDRRGHD